MATACGCVSADCISYSQFCARYSDWLKKQKRSMRQTHRAGEKLFIDYAGPMMPVVCAANGEIRTAQIFVAVLGASNYSYAEATWSQSLPGWLGSHVRAFEFFGGTPVMLVPDNLKNGMTKACRYEPELNPSYQLINRWQPIMQWPWCLPGPINRRIKPRSRSVFRLLSAGLWLNCDINPFSPWQN